MPDTVRTRTELEALLPIQTAGEVSVQDLRDVLASTVLHEDTSSFATAIHTHAITDVTGLVTALNTKLAVTGGTIVGSLNFTDGSEYTIDINNETGFISCNTINCFNIAATGNVTAVNFVGEQTKTGITISAGEVLTPSVSKGSVVPYDATISHWYISSDVATTASVRIRINSASGTILSASAPITLTAAMANNSTTLTGWTTNVSKGDVIYYDLTANDNAHSIDVDLLLTHR